jgi:hypothetical protein
MNLNLFGQIREPFAATEVSLRALFGFDERRALHIMQEMPWRSNIEHPQKLNWTLDQV